MFLKDFQLVDPHLSDTEDKELMNQLTSSNLVAWSALIKKYGKLVYSVCFQILNNNSDAEDALQNTFMRLKLYANKYDSSQPLKPWLARIASGEAIRIYQKKKHTGKKESVRMENKYSSIESQRRDVAEIVEQQEVESLVKKAITLLPETSRMALTLYYAGGLNQSEIAVELGVSQVSISERIKSGLEKVKLYLKKAGVQAAIVLSPNLMQDCIISVSAPNELILKLANDFPSKTQFTELVSSSVPIGVSAKSKKVSIVWLWYILSFSITILIGFNLWKSKTEEITLPVIQKNENASLKQARIFQPIDFNNYDPITYYKGMIQKDLTNPKDLVEGDFQNIGGKKRWIVQENSNGQTFITRDKDLNGQTDGLYLNGSFSEPYLFKGKVKTFSDKIRFGFTLKLAIAKIAKSEIVHSNDLQNNINVGGHFNEICSMNIAEPVEMDFKVYVWTNQVKWLSATFVKIKGYPQEFFISGSLTHLNENFRFGIFSNSKLEGQDFEHCPLGLDWNYQNEPDIKKSLDKFPKDFFLVIIESK